MAQKKDSQPLSFKVAYWYSLIFAGIFLLYGVVKIILSFLDRSYADVWQMALFALLGGLLFALAVAFREGKFWGWYGLISVNILVAVQSALGLSHKENIVLLLLSAAVLYALFHPRTKGHLQAGV